MKQLLKKLTYGKRRTAAVRLRWCLLMPPQRTT